MRSIYLIISSCFFLHVDAVLAQNHTIITGKIVNSMGIGIPYCHITIEGTRIGTLSNDSGHFQIKLTSSKCSEEITISHVSYSIKKVFFNCKSNNLSIQLQERSYNLHEVEISAFSVEAIVLKCIRSIKNNYQVDSVNYEMFTRITELNKKNDDPILLKEYVFNMYHRKNFKSDFVIQKARGRGYNKIGKKMLKDARVIDIKISEAFILPRYIPNFLKKSKMNRYSYNLIEELDVGDDTYYVIEISSKKKNYLSEGLVWIHKENFGIHLLEKKYLDENWNDIATNNRLTRSFYRQVGNLWYLSHGYKYQTTTYHKENLTIEREIFSVSTGLSFDIPFSKKEDIGNTARKFDSDLKDYRNDKEYWNEYNYIPLDSMFGGKSR